jgi:acyl-CoA reductase-like NAD-dependent aldehyde dehydrogenase
VARGAGGSDFPRARAVWHKPLPRQATKCLRAAQLEYPETPFTGETLGEVPVGRAADVEQAAAAARAAPGID